jgi:ribosomal protein S18 acetylase RimI-like enzyme
VRINHEPKSEDTMTIQIRDAGETDAPALVRLIEQLAGGFELTNPLTEEYARECLAFPGSHVLLAEVEGEAIGLLSSSVRPDLFHAAPSCTIDELIVEQAHRGRGAGSALLGEVLRRAAALGCVEVSVTVMPDNEGAQRLYRSHGLVDEAVYLETHLEGGAP